MDSYNFEQWLDKIFIPFAKKHMMDPTKPIVLFVDGHETHETMDVKCVVYKHLDNEDLEIAIFCFPSKTMHKCQPLDVGVLAHVEHH